MYFSGCISGEWCIRRILFFYDFFLFAKKEVVSPVYLISYLPDLS